MSHSNIPEEDRMRRPVVRTLALLVLAAGLLALGGCTNPLEKIEVGTYIVIPNFGNQPDWLDNDTLIGLDGPNLTIVEAKAANGDAISVTPIDASGALNCFHIGVSPDKSQVVYGVGYAEGTDYTDIIVHNLETDVATNVTNGAGNYHGCSFLSNTEIVYFDYEYDSPSAGDVTNRVIKHNLTTDTPETLYEASGVDQGGGEFDGLAFYWGKAGPGIGKIVAPASDSSITGYSFAILDADTGAILFNGFDHGWIWSQVRSADWVDADTVAIGAGSQRNYSYFVIDISETGGEQLAEIEMDDDRFTDLYGVNVSPDGTMIASHFAELDASDDFVGNWNVITRIAPPPEE
jgi:hypothetical protein